MRTAQHCLWKLVLLLFAGSFWVSMAAITIDVAKSGLKRQFEHLLYSSEEIAGK